MTLQLTHEEYLVLSKIAYMNIDKELEFKQYFTDASIKEMAERLLKEKAAGYERDFGSYGGLTNREHYQMLQDIVDGKYKNLSNLKVKDYDNQNETNGFVAYAFYDANNPQNVFITFRGSEGNTVGDEGFWAALDGKTKADWIDNFYLGTKGVSSQFKPTKAFVERNMDKGGQTFVTGHSKGSANAAYACASIDGVTGIAFDGPGIGQALTLEETERLIQSGFINIVNQKDPVGALLFHPEKRIFAKHHDFYELDKHGEKLMVNGKPEVVEGFFSGHYIQALGFDSDGKVIEDNNRAFFESVLVEKITQATYIVNEVMGQPLGMAVDHVHINKVGYNIFQTALADLKQDLSAAINNNAAKTKEAIDNIIITTVQEVNENITNCNRDIGIIKNEVDLGAENIKRRLDELFITLRPELSEGIFQVTNGLTELWACVNLKQEIEDILIRIKQGDGIIEAIFTEEVDRLENFVSSIRTIEAGLDNLESDIIKAYIQANVIIIKETEETTFRIKDEWVNLAENTMELAVVMDNFERQVKASINQGLMETAKAFIFEFKENYRNAKRQAIALVKHLNQIYVDSNLLRFRRLMGVASYVYRSSQIAVTTTKLNDLSFKLRRMHNDFDEQISGQLRAVKNLINSVNAEYREDNVRVASSAVLMEVERIERLYSTLSQKIYQKEMALKSAADKYTETEARLIADMLKN